jgi:hypothetical protein
VAPHYKEADEGWEILLFLCKDIPGVQVERRPNYRVRFPSGGMVQVRSAEDPQSLRGATLSGLVLDEAAQISREAWEVVLQPTLAVSQGWATFISTPKGLNWFYDLYRDVENRLARGRVAELRIGDQSPGEGDPVVGEERLLLRGGLGLRGLGGVALRHGAPPRASVVVPTRRPTAERARAVNLRPQAGASTHERAARTG